MRVGVVGSRTLTDKEWMWGILDMQLSALPKGQLTIVSGEAKGADLFAKEWALSRGYDYHGLPAQWVIEGKFNRDAGFKRNNDIVVDTEFGIAFWDLDSNGTRHTINLYRKANKPVAVHHFTPTKQETNDLTDLFE